MLLTKNEIEMVYNVIGTIVYNQEGEKIGFVAGIFSVNEQDASEYIIVGSEHLAEGSTKYYAIPAYTELLEVSSADSSVTLKFKKDHLLRAKRISVDKCPKPFEYEPLIYELTDFPIASEENASC